MFAIQENGSELHFSIASDMALVDRFVALAKEFMERQGTTRFSEIIIVLRELLINAVEHGNTKNRSLIVEGTLEALGQDRFCIRVQDEGRGVDASTLSFTMPEDPSQDRSRGFALIHAFSDEVRFSQSPSTITAWVSVPAQSLCTHRMEGDCARIFPGGDITAASAENLRRLLLKVLDQGVSRFCLDLSATSDIDSIGLSLLIAFARILKENSSEGSLEIQYAAESLETLFRMTRLDRMYTIVRNQKDKDDSPC
ncbi:anti-anti-sigma factor [Desulfobotulus alkaliphilus]|uniref:Anti-anti-sigma factor n=1 Tax=Desulfobotulus alkaliphilus TaxID=622671 RepID=A0A562R8S7_9BACT|nr:ATP-binding protein [Desulfobotulus alkaliphilus]TWI64840.1 anti-anti-sigma factor [Desulfobotulus alkaliphilus]